MAKQMTSWAVVSSGRQDTPSARTVCAATVFFGCDVVGVTVGMPSTSVDCAGSKSVGGGVLRDVSDLAYCCDNTLSVSTSLGLAVVSFSSPPCFPNELLLDFEFF